MAAIAHIFVEQTTIQQTTSTSYVDISGASIADTSFVTGAKYLLVLQALNTIDSANLSTGIRALHGSTAFAQSERVLEPNSATAYYGYGFFTVWTAVSGEGIKLQHRILTTGTANTDDITLFAMRLDADLVENTDWKFAESTTDTDLTTSAQSFASTSITPGSNSDWLVFGYMQSATTTLTVSQQCRLVRSGEAASSVPEIIFEAEDATDDILQFSLMRAFALTGGQSNTFTIEALLSGTGAAGDSHLHSAVFILNMNKFRNHNFGWDAAGVTLSNTDFATLVQSLSLTPEVAGDVWVGHQWMNDAATISAKSRLQVDDTDQPDTQTSGARVQMVGWDARDQGPLMMQTVENLTAAAHTFDVDGSSPGVSVPAIQRSIFAVTMELAAAVTAPFPPWPPPQNTLLRM